MPLPQRLVLTMWASTQYVLFPLTLRFVMLPFSQPERVFRRGRWDMAIRFVSSASDLSYRVATPFLDQDIIDAH